MSSSESDGGVTEGVLVVVLREEEGFGEGSDSDFMCPLEDSRGVSTVGWGSAAALEAWSNRSIIRCLMTSFLSEMSFCSFSCRIFRICFADIVWRSLEASIPSIMAEYCARSAGSKDIILFSIQRQQPLFSG